MKAVIQRVSRASLEVDGSEFSSIEQGLVVLLGIGLDDDLSDILWLMNKIVQMRIFSDDNGKMNLSVKDVDGELMLVSQFTLYASTKKGNRPSYLDSAKPDTAIPLYEKCIEVADELMSKKCATGVFGADMKINLTNDGPVTITIDTRNKV